MTPRTFLIVDDERPARLDILDRLRQINADFILHEADSVRCAREVLTRTAVDVIFLDIQLMGETGFDLLTRHDITASVVFVTAYDEFALKAFEVNACDYLLKPVSQSRFEQTMSRLLNEQPKHPKPQSEMTLSDRLIERTASGLKVIALSEVEYISAEDDYSRIHTICGAGHLVSRRMAHWQHVLPSHTFIRIHRSYIVNLVHTGDILQTPQGGHLIQMKNSKKNIPISRKGLKTIRSDKA